MDLSASRKKTPDAAARSALTSVAVVATSAASPSLGQRLSIWSKTISLRAIVTVTVVTVVASTGLALLRINYSLLKDNKTRDVWAIYFLEMESRAKAISEQLLPNGAGDAGHAATATTGTGLITPSIYSLENALNLRLVSGPDRKLDSAAAFGIKRKTEIADFNLVWLKNRTYAIRRLDGGNQLALAPFAKKVRFKVRNAAISQTIVYIATRQGRLVYSNSPAVGAKNFQSRPLVQKFITLPVSQGQLELTGDDGEEFYGFFMEIPNTNMVILAETRKDVVLAQVTKSTRQLVYIVLSIVGSISLFLFISLTMLLKPIGRVADMALTIATGNLDVKMKPSSLGEIRTLTQAFSTMIAGLRRRDAVISELMQEQATRIRLESELAIAKTIQENLLTNAKIPPHSGVDIRAIYTPATEVAGDWYGYFYDEASQSTVVAVVDISGHGVGSSMFTAIVAAMFEEFRENFAEQPELCAFFGRLNRQLRRYGRDAWHATALAAVYRHGAKTLDLVSAGHPRPIISDSSSKTFHALSTKPSTPLGIQDEMSVATDSVPFVKGQSLMIFTDGLSEWRGPKGRFVGIKGLVKGMNAQPPTQTIQGGSRLFEIAQIFAKEVPQSDDICIITMSAS